MKGILGVIIVLFFNDMDLELGENRYLTISIYNTLK